MRILFVSSEVYPFAKTGGLADVSQALPLAINRLGHECSVVLPYYKEVRKNGFEPKLAVDDIRIHVGNRECRYKLYYIRKWNTDFFFVDYPDFFDRDFIYGFPNGGPYSDNAMRFAFFSKSILGLLNYIKGIDIIHCNDWQTALIPLYLKLSNMDVKTLLTIHNIAFQGIFDPQAMFYIGIPHELFRPDGVEFYGKVNFLKAGIKFATAVNTVSRKYASEILVPYYSYNLDGVLRERADGIAGITNGVNYNEWDPAEDKLIASNFSKTGLAGKLACKQDLLKTFNLPADDTKPVFGVVSRMAEQKGMDILISKAEEIIRLGAVLVVLGTGEEKYANMFRDLARRFPESIGAAIAFDDVLAHKIIAGSDMLIMPSKYEPCGLSQLYALRYGTVPVVRATGGLEDTIEDFNEKTKKGNGFKFIDAWGEPLLQAVKRAVETYKKKDVWQALQANCFKSDFSWKKPAKEYAELYVKIVPPKPEAVEEIPAEKPAPQPVTALVLVDKEVSPDKKKAEQLS